MSILTTAGSAVVSGFWKAGAIAALVGGVMSSAALGYQWHMAAHDRDQALAELKTEKDKSADLTMAIREQNLAVGAMGKAKEAAEARGLEAQQLAAANGRRFDRALDDANAKRATTCAEAMPAVNAALEAIR